MIETMHAFTNSFLPDAVAAAAAAVLSLACW